MVFICIDWKKPPYLVRLSSESCSGSMSPFMQVSQRFLLRFTARWIHISVWLNGEFWLKEKHMMAPRKTELYEHLETVLVKKKHPVSASAPCDSTSFIITVATSSFPGFCTADIILIFKQRARSWTRACRSFFSSLNSRFCAAARPSASPHIFYPPLTGERLLKCCQQQHALIKSAEHMEATLKEPRSIVAVFHCSPLASTTTHSRRPLFDF